MKFPESKLAHKYLDGLQGIEIGAAAHNPFGLNTLNFDICEKSEIYQKEQIRICGEFAKVDVVCPGDSLGILDKSVDFVISSHVIEHFYNPIAALKEWNRVARKYIFIIAPHKDRMFDFDKEATIIQTFQYRERFDNLEKGDKHHCFFTTESFKELIEYVGFEIVEYHNFDDKVGNGFMFVLKTS